MAFRFPLLRFVERQEASCRPLRRYESDQPQCCFYPKTPPKLPDLATYSQDEQFSLGVAPTWDSPDITTNFVQPPGLLSPLKLLPETLVTVRNLSASVSAVNAVVSLYVSAFGIGMDRSLESQKTISLDPGAQVTLKFALSQAWLHSPDQRIGAYVRIDHPYDARLINNRGSRLLFAGFATVVVGRQPTLSIPVRNPLNVQQQVSFSVMPNELNASIQQNAMFGPLAQGSVALNIQVPPTLHGANLSPVRKDVTVVGRNQDGTVIDGLTYGILVDD